LPISTRKYPFVQFDSDREAGKDLLRVDGISKSIEGVKVLDNISFHVNKGDKIVFLGESDLAKTTLFQILMGEVEPDSGTYTWGVTTSQTYFPSDNSSYFNDGEYDLVDWLRQYSKDQDAT